MALYSAPPGIRGVELRFIRAFTVFLFYLSQAFAPLVHAHVGVDLSPAAFHLPGLEAATYSGLSGSASFEDRGGLVVQAAKGVRSWPPVFPPGVASIPAAVRLFALPSAWWTPSFPRVSFFGSPHVFPPPCRAPPAWV